MTTEDESVVTLQRNDTPRASVRCVDCDAPILTWDVHVLECRHLAHRGCTKCAPCDPKRRRNRYVTRIGLFLFGAFGGSDAFVGDHRLSVMLALTFGGLWSLRLILVPVFYVLGKYDPTELLFVFVFATYYGGIHQEFVVALALWIAGMYGYELGFGSVLDFTVSVSIFTGLLMAFRIHDAVGACIVALYVFRVVWKKPTIWDLHPGNCCGVGTAFLIMIIVSGVSATVVGMTVFHSFHVATVLHGTFLASTLFSRQTRDPFDRDTAEIVRSIGAVFAVAVFARKARSQIHASYHHE